MAPFLFPTGNRCAVLARGEPRRMYMVGGPFMKRKLLSILLTFCLAFSLLPTAALADERPDTNLPAADENGVITLTNDVTITGRQWVVAAGETLTLDLSGYTVKISKYTAEKGQVLVKGTLTVKDSSKAGTGKICSDYTGTAGRVIDVENGTLILQSGKITMDGMVNAGVAVSGSAVYIGGTGSFKMDGGEVAANNVRASSAVNVKSSSASFEMTGGSVTAEASGNETSIYAVSGSSSSIIKISAGTISAPTALSARTSNSTITGGTFTGAISVKVRSISGGAFDTDVTSYCADGLMWENGQIVPLTETAAAAQIGNNFYTTFARANTVAQDGDTIKLLKDASTSSLKAGVTYDLNGYTLTCTKTSAIEYSSKVMSFIDSSVTGSERGGTLKFTKLRGATTAAIKAQAGATLNLKNINFVSNASGLFPAENATALNIENCDVSSSVFCVGTNAATLENYGVIITLKDSIFTSTASDGDNTPVYINVEGTLNIDNCELTGGRQGLMVRAGTANIKNSTITTTGKYTNRDQYYASAWKDGNEVPAAALVVGNYAAGAATAYEANAVVTVENTKLTGENGFPALYVDGNTTYTSSVTLGGENTYVSGKIMKGQQTAEGKVLLTVTGGLFSSDPSAYCAEGKTGVASGNSQYPYTVGTKDANAKPAHVDTATVPAKTDENASQDVKNVASEITGANVTNNAAEAATKDLANENKLTGDDQITVNGTTKTITEAVKEVTSDSNLTKDNVAIVYQTYVDVTVTDAKKDETGVTEITVNLTPMYRVVATTSDVVNRDLEIKVEGDTGVNAVVIQEGVKLNLPEQEYEVSLALPDGFANANDKLSIKHTKDNGTVEYYTGTVSEESNKLYVTFTTKGFSPFTISAPAASIDGTMYPTLADAISAAANGATVKLEKACTESVNVSGKSLTIDRNGKTYDFAKVTVDSNSTKTENGDTLTITYTAPSSSSGSSGYYVSTPSKTENGSVTVSPKSASKGDTVTVTVKPDSGYVLETLTVTDKNGNELTLKDKGNGKYTFTMPAGKVEVKATFMEDNSMLNFFYDVPNNAYFYEAVKWAVENGITTGVGNDLFAPEQPCTRAQIVTFLWRAAGSPEPKGAASGMTDVVSGSYYEKAVAWAIENGITTGTTTSTFSPDATCTRAQAVTFLARALNAKAASAAEFSDVPADSYFADAVAWAAANGVTEGIGGGLFGSDNDCTRGQIVTFLYRAYNK